MLLWTSLLLLTGCSTRVDQSQVNTESGVVAILEAGHPVGQTFVAYHAGLSGVEIWLEPGPDVQGEIWLRLRDDPQSERDLATARLLLGQVTTPGFYRFSFAPLQDSHGRYYYAFLELVGEGIIQVGTGPGDVYLDGAGYRDHQPLDMQVAFRLAYDSLWTLLDLGQAVVGWLGLLGIAGVLYIVPGWALLTCLPVQTGDWIDERLSWAGKLGIAVGSSLAVYPLLLLWTDLVGLHLGPLYAWLPIAAGGGAIVWRHRTWRPRRGWEALRRWAHSEALWPDLALLAVLGLVFGVRLLVVRSLEAPLWGDSYHHTMITQLLVDRGGLFDSWEPYAALQTLTYHFGLHSALAAFHWLTGLEPMLAAIWVGQILGGLAVLALYPLAVRISGSRWAGVGAVLIAGLLSSMPMYYVNWGRYSQLAGQVILPSAVLLTWAALEAPRRRWWLGALCWITVGGLALTHYRVLIFYVVFVLAWMLSSLRWDTWRRVLSRVTWVGVGAALLFLPWFGHTFAGTITQGFIVQLSTRSSQLSSFEQSYNTIGDIFSYLPPPLWLTLLIAAAVGLWQRQRGVRLMVLWWFLLLIATNPAWLHLPGTGAISNFALFIAAYIPAGVLIGALFGQLMTRVASRKWLGALAVLFVVAMGLGGMRERMGDIRPDRHALLTRPDLQAMAWIREHVPEDATFLANSFLAYDASVIVGSDGGWWLPLLTGRANTVPPLSYGSEQGPQPGYREWVNELTWHLQREGIDSPEMAAMLRERGITHVYIGQRQGRVNYAGPHVLDPEVLLDSDHYRVVYHRDRVWVFEVDNGRGL